MSNKVFPKILKEINMCGRCLTRYTSKHISSDVLKHIEDAIEKHCGICLSILEQNQVDNAIQMISEAIKEKCYSTGTFSLAISLPQSLILREKSLACYVKQNGQADSLFQNYNIKDTLRLTILSSLESSTGKKFDKSSPLLVNLNYDYKNEVEEMNALNPILPKPTNKRKWQNKHNKNQKTPVNSVHLISDVVKDINDFNVFRYTPVPPEPVSEPCILKVSCCHEPVYLAEHMWRTFNDEEFQKDLGHIGRYNKYSRELSQTPWLIEGKRKSESSVQELITEGFISYSKCTEVKFMSSGREDVDVRMLGRGRPFVISLMDPKITEFSKERLKQMQNDVNTSTKLVAIRDLQQIERDGLSCLKSGEEEKTKSYSAKVWCPEEISLDKINNLNSLKEFVINQSTPIRVLHRRPACVRDRTIYTLRMERLDDHHYTLKLKTQAGTYIKEFVHSDFGRTSPSLCSLLDAPVDILELDVDEVELDWPPSLETT